MWDLQYLNDRPPKGPFNVVINRLCKRRDLSFLNKIVHLADQVVVSKDCVQRLDGLRKRGFIETRTAPTIEGQLSQMANDHLTLVFSDDHIAGNLQNIQIQSRYGSQIHYISQDSASVVLPRGTSEFVVGGRTAYHLFPLHGRTDAWVCADGGPPESIVLDMQGEIEAGACEAKLTVTCDMPSLAVFRARR